MLTIGNTRVATCGQGFERCRGVKYDKTYFEYKDGRARSRRHLHGGNRCISNPVNPLYKCIHTIFNIKQGPATHGSSQGGWCEVLTLRVQMLKCHRTAIILNVCFSANCAF